MVSGMKALASVFIVRVNGINVTNSAKLMNISREKSPSRNVSLKLLESITNEIENDSLFSKRNITSKTRPSGLTRPINDVQGDYLLMSKQKI